MDNRNQLFRQIPSVNTILKDVRFQQENLPKSTLVQIIRDYLDNFRQKIYENKTEKISTEQIIFDILKRIQRYKKPSQRRVINATGTILHTGLGRAVLSRNTISKIVSELSGYSLLEVDHITAKRSHRDHHLKDLLCILTGAEDATIVNNNAAAVLIALSALAEKKEVIVSNGQLVEIGGSFRVPEIIAQSGAKFTSVGCTNKVHLKDYENAISEETTVLLHVHTSNYKVVGFTHHVELQELAELAQKKGIVLIEDAGSGALLDLSPWGFTGEPLIQESIKKGADVVTFSGDKLLGGSQAGIIVGKSLYIEKIRRHPLARALRVDKLTLTALESTLSQFLDPSKVITENPTLAMLTMSSDAVKKRAEKIAKTLEKEVLDCSIEVVSSNSCVGSGALPTFEIPSYAVAVQPKGFSVEEFARLLRCQDPCVFSCIHKNNLFIHPRTLQPNEDNEIVRVIKAVIDSKRNTKLNDTSC